MWDMVTFNLELQALLRTDMYAEGRNDGFTVENIYSEPKPET